MLNACWPDENRGTYLIGGKWQSSTSKSRQYTLGNIGLELVRECSSFSSHFHASFCTMLRTQIPLKPVVRKSGLSAAAVRGLTYTVLTGTNLVDGSVSNVVPVYGVSPAASGFETVTNRIPTADGQGFMKLKVELGE